MIVSGFINDKVAQGIRITVLTTQSVIAHAPEHQAVRQRLPADIVYGRVAPVIAQADGTTAHCCTDVKLRTAHLPFKLRVKVTVVLAL